MCTLVNPKSAIGVPSFSSKSIAPPSVLVSLNNLPVLETVVVGSPVILLSPAKTTLACASACTLKMFIALPLASSSFNLPSPSIVVVKLSTAKASITVLMSVPLAIPAPYCALPLGAVVTLTSTLPAPVLILALNGMYPPNSP